MFSVLSSLFIFDYILLQLIPFCILVIGCWAHKEFDFEISEKFRRWILPYSNDQRRAMWIVGVIAVYFFLKLVIYNLLFTSGTATIVKIDSRENIIAELRNSGVHRPGTGNISGLRKIEVTNPVFEMKVGNKLVRFESSRILKESDVKLGNEFTFVYIDFLGEPMFEDFGGLYFFRHDITVLFILIVSLFWAWQPRYEEGWESGKGSIYKIPAGGGIFKFAFIFSLVLPVGVEVLVFVQLIIDLFSNALFNVHS